jgi:hypothetical protein
VPLSPCGLGDGSANEPNFSINALAIGLVSARKGAERHEFEQLIVWKRAFIKKVRNFYEYSVFREHRNRRNAVHRLTRHQYVNPLHPLASAA